ncbi:MAG: hypothetical protein PVI07_09570 [Anaerolineae bacterium]|jgi:hypothetical protein
MSVTESVVRCLAALGLLAAPFIILILISLWRERRGDWKRSRLARGAVGGALALEAALDPSRREAIEYTFTDQGEVQEEDGEGQGVPQIVVAPADVVYTPRGPARSDEEDCCPGQPLNSEG